VLRKEKYPCSYVEMMNRIISLRAHDHVFSNNFLLDNAIGEEHSFGKKSIENT
jgi:hypothetical protein